jgi:hypothetical protein
MNKIKFLYFYSTLIFTVSRSMVLQSRQNMNKSMYLDQFQDKILFQNKFLFCPQIFQLTHFAKWANSEKIKFYFYFFPPSEDLSKFECAKQDIKHSRLTDVRVAVSSATLTCIHSCTFHLKFMKNQTMHTTF